MLAELHAREAMLKVRVAPRARPDPPGHVIRRVR
jgi:hypothetical protein